MAKKPKQQHIKQDYILVNKERRISRINGGFYWDLTWIGVQDQREYHTAVDSVYDNFKDWEDLINSKQYHGVYSGLKPTSKTTKQGGPVLSADGTPHCEIPLTEDELARVITAMIAEPVSTYNNLFETK